MPEAPALVCIGKQLPDADESVHLVSERAKQGEPVGSFIEECERAPRLNEPAGFFASTAASHSGKPVKEPQVDRRLLNGDKTLDRFVRLHEQRRGPFDQHYHSSIPYRLEEECRLGHAILQYSKTRAEPLHLYSLGTAEGTMARTVSELAEGGSKAFLAALTSRIIIASSLMESLRMPHFLSALSTR